MKSLFEKGPVFVLDVVRDEVEWFFGDCEGQGIGSSDINACLKSICGTVCNDANLENYNPVELSMVRTAISNALFDLEV